MVQRRPQPQAAPAVDMRGIDKRFGDTVALAGVDLVVPVGEVHGLLGENGAGKTTLMNVLTGLYRADSGQVRLKGEPVEMRSPRDAIAHRVGMVHQHFELVQAFTAFENILLGADTGTWTMDTAAHRRRIADLAAQYGFEVDLDRRVADLEIGDQQKIEILRILYAGVDILVLDEPTTHLTPHEVEQLFAAVRELAADGLTVILIAHKLHEVLSVVDRLTVLRRGQLAGSLDAEHADEGRIVGLMMGADATIPQVRPKNCEIGDDEVLALRSASSPSDGVAVALEDLNLAVRAGELVGVAGVAGNGQRELVELLAGIRPVAAGTLEVNGTDVTGASVAQRIRQGMAVLPGDRMREGVLPAQPLYETYNLGLHVLSSGRWRPGHLRARAREVIDRYDVRCAGESAPTAGLSGGNIQKVLVARALSISDEADGGIVVAMNPTSGLDVGAAAFVHDQLVRTCEQGGGVLLISEDLDELLHMSDRVLVLSQGRIVSSQSRDAYDRYQLGRHMVAARG